MVKVTFWVDRACANLAVPSWLQICSFSVARRKHLLLDGGAQNWTAQTRSWQEQILRNTMLIMTNFEILVENVF